MEVPAGFETRQLPVKILYTLGRDRTQKFVAKPSTPLPVRTENATAGIGLLDISQCLKCVINVCPELSEFSEHSDYSLCSVDHSETELPLLAHGLLSAHLTPDSATAGQFLAGRICETKLHPQILEVELSFTPLGKRKYTVLSQAYEPSPPPPPLPFSEDLPLAQTMRSMPVSLSPPNKFLAGRDPRQIPLPSSARLLSDVPSSDLVATGIKRISPRKRFAASLFIPPSSPPRSSSAQHFAPPPMAGASQPPRRQRRGDKIDSQLTHALMVGAEPEFCHNCGDVRTSAWRKTKVDGKELNLCNACGLYFRTKNIMRPKELFNRKSRTTKNQAAPRPSSRRLSTLPLPADVTRLERPLPSSHTSPHEEATPVDASPEEPPSHLSEGPSEAMESALEPPSTPGRPQRVEASSNCNTLAPTSSSDPNVPSTPDSQPNKENVPPEARFMVLTTPNKRPDQFAGGSGSARRWLRTHIFSRSEDDVFEAFMQSPSKRYGNQQAAEFDVRVQKLYVSEGPGISSSPPFYQLEGDLENTWFDE